MTARARFAAHPFLAVLPESARAALWAAGRVQRIDAGAPILREGDQALCYWLLLEGTVRVFYRSADGLEVTVKIFAAPAAWGELQLLTDHVHTEDLACVDEAECFCVPKPAFLALLDTQPAFMKRVLVDTAARFLIAAQNERALAFLTVPERLAHLFLSYVRVYGEDTSDGVRIKTRLSHERLAADLGVVKKSVTRTLSLWTDQGVIVKDGASYRVRDLARLVERSPKGLIGVDWSAGTRVQTRVVDDDDSEVPRRK